MLPERSARRFTLSGLVISQSGAVSPSPVPLIGWSDVTETICESGLGSTKSTAATFTVTGTMLWLGGQSVRGDVEMLVTGGGWGAGTVRVNDRCAPLCGGPG